MLILNFMSFFLLSVLFIHCTCTQEESVNEQHEKDKYKLEYNVKITGGEKWLKYFEAFERAEKDFQKCDGCQCFVQLIDSELSRWNASGITRDDIERAKQSTRGIHYQIVDHRLYRQKDCLFPARCEGVEHFINKFVNKLPNMDLIINVFDYPQAPVRWPPTPVLSFSKTNDYQDISYPAWAFWSGGPAIDQYPAGIGRWDLLRPLIVKYYHEWGEKESIAFFRGSRTSSERDPLILLSRAKPELIDAKYTKNQAWKSLKDTLGVEPFPTIPFEEQCKYKYLFNLRGVAASFRYKHLFLCKSLVLNVDSDWSEFFYHRLKPWHHFVPIASDFSDSEDILLFLKENDEIAKKIANNGFDFIWNHLTMEAVECYWNELLQRYAKLLKLSFLQDKTLILIPNK